MKVKMFKFMYHSSVCDSNARYRSQQPSFNAAVPVQLCLIDIVAAGDPHALYFKKIDILVVTREVYAYLSINQI